MGGQVAEPQVVRSHTRQAAKRATDLGAAATRSKEKLVFKMWPPNGALGRMCAAVRAIMIARSGFVPATKLFCDLNTKSEA